MTEKLSRREFLQLFKIAPVSAAVIAACAPRRQENAYSLDLLGDDWALVVVETPLTRNQKITWQNNGWKFSDEIIDFPAYTTFDPNDEKAIAALRNATPTDCTLHVLDSSSSQILVANCQLIDITIPLQSAPVVHVRGESAQGLINFDMFSFPKQPSPKP